MQPGTVIANRYRVNRLIGEGGMGSVYEGEHIAVGRKVAIKVLHAHIARRPGVTERFEREARAAGAIGHEHIIDVIDFGTYGESPFMVMEYLRGEGLGARLAEQGRVPVEVACAIMGQVLSALSAAHAAGIVHRDLKPDNVFLVARGADYEFVKLLDFGISKFNDARDEGRSLTRPGTLMGTPHYMSPEQAMARPDVDARADIYSAGVMLYEMLTGALPFDGASDAEILIKICQRTAEPRPACEINTLIPAELDAVVRRAIAFDREERFQGAAELLAALRPFGAGTQPPRGESLMPTRRESALPPVVSSGTPTAWITPSQPATMIEEGRAGRSDAAPSRWPRTWLPLAIGSVLAVGAALGSVALLRARRSASVERVPAPAARPPSPALPPAVTAADPARVVRITLAGLPADARVWIDQRETSAREVELPRGSTHQLRVEAPGRQAYDESFVAERAETLRLSLAEVAPPPPPPTTSPPALAPTPVAAPAPTSARSGRHARVGRHPRGAAAGAARPAGALLAPTQEY